MSEQPTRRLAAIVSADVVGYSRLMGADEAGTHARLKGRFKELIEPSIAGHNGRIVKLMGDGLLAEFSSAVDAVSWAVDVQAKISELNSGSVDTERLEYRVGVNIGDVIVDDGDLFGDGVNVAARLQEIAEPGGVCISAKVHGEVAGKLDAPFDDGGEKTLKNITEPVRVWRWPPDQRKPHSSSIANRPELSLPDKPSVAVLPFENMSGDPEQEFFVDGIVEDILTTLSKIPDLFVIARNSSFVYKGQPIDVRRVGRELGVAHVVEGSVRKAGNRVRVSAQLIDCSSGAHVWADRFDGELDDIFDLQDRITKEIVASLQITLTEGEQSRIWLQRSGSLQAYEAYHKCELLYQNFARQTHQQTRQELERVLSTEPNNTLVLYLYGLTLVDMARFGWTNDRDGAFSRALEVAEQAISIDPYFGNAFSIISYARTFQREHDLAIQAAEQAVTLSPNFFGLHMSAMTHIFAGNFETALSYELRANRHNPLDHQVSLIEIARAQYHLGNFEEARRQAARVLVTQSRWLTAQTILLASLWRLGLEDESRKIAALVQRTQPNFSVGRWSRGWPYRLAEDLEALLEPLRAVGLTD